MKLLKRKGIKGVEKGFSVLNFNTLAKCLCTDGPKGFPYVKPKKVLSWDYRAPLLIEELKNNEADVMCLHEVDQFEMFKKGFDSSHIGIFHPKPIPTFKGADCNGTAILYSKKKFSLIKKELFQYHQNHNQIAIILLLKDIITENKLLIASTHLKAKWNGSKTRLFQIQHLLKKVDTFLEKMGEDKGKIPLIITGDMNDVSSSPFYKHITEEKKFKSAYGNNSEGITTYKKRGLAISNPVKRTIDYIFFKNCTVVDTLEIPNLDVFPDVGLPSGNYPSDHLLISASFKYQQ